MRSPADAALRARSSRRSSELALGFLGPGPIAAHIEHAAGFLRALADVAGTVVDLGSGGGVPGLVLAVARPDLALVLLEAMASAAASSREAVRRARRPSTGWWRGGPRSWAAAPAGRGRRRGGPELRAPGGDGRVRGAAAPGRRPTRRQRAARRRPRSVAGRRAWSSSGSSSGALARVPVHPDPPPAGRVPRPVPPPGRPARQAARCSDGPAVPRGTPRGRISADSRSSVPRGNDRDRGPCVGPAGAGRMQR